jgi:hypothetical protein
MSAERRCHSLSSGRTEQVSSINLLHQHSGSRVPSPDIFLWLCGNAATSSLDSGLRLLLFAEHKFSLWRGEEAPDWANWRLRTVSLSPFVSLSLFFFFGGRGSRGSSPEQLLPFLRAVKPVMSHWACGAIIPASGPEICVVSGDIST